LPSAGTLGKERFALGKGCVVLDKELPVKKRSAKASLSSVFYRALGKAFA